MAHQSFVCGVGRRGRGSETHGDDEPELGWGGKGDRLIPAEQWPDLVENMSGSYSRR